MSGRVGRDDAAFKDYVETAKKTPVEEQNECQKVALARSFSWAAAKKTQGKVTL